MTEQEMFKLAQEELIHEAISVIQTLQQKVDSMTDEELIFYITMLEDIVDESGR